MRLTWQEIRRSFNDLWVEMRDVDWDDNFMPVSAIISSSGFDRAELLKTRSSEGIVIYIGAAKGFVPALSEQLAA